MRDVRTKRGYIFIALIYKTGAFYFKALLFLHELVAFERVR